MKIIKVTNRMYKDNNVAYQVGGEFGYTWEKAKPELLEPNLIEKIRHNIFRQHISFGQPYCVICGLEEKV